MPNPLTSDRAERDLATEFESLAIAPAEPQAWRTWLDQLKGWRTRAHEILGVNDLRYREPESQWARSAHSCGVVMLWDEAFYNSAERRFTVEEYLDEAERSFGGFDVVILWHAYPRIGFDERNQFDYYRDIPGGLDALSGIVQTLHARGVKALLDYNPWDSGMRSEGKSDEQALADMVVALKADGLFLDTLANAPSALQAALNVAHPGTVLQSEHTVPLSGVGEHLMSWAQWPAHLDRPVVLRNKWFEPRQMQHIVRRWHSSHREELQVAWLNGTGIVIWENVFGSWVPWSDADKHLIRTMRPVFKTFANCFEAGEWSPYIPTKHARLQASRWDWGGASLWTFANRTSDRVEDAITTEDFGANATAFDLLTGDRLNPADLCLACDPFGVGALVCLDDTTHPDVVGLILSFLSTRPYAQQPTSRAVKGTGPVRRPVPSTPGLPAVPQSMTVVESGPRDIVAIFRMRECGAYSGAQLVDHSDPDLSGDIQEHRHVKFVRIAIDTFPVSNSDFLDFVQATNYVAADSNRFLAHWIDGRPRAEDLPLPVTFVDLDDARSYARWANRRLPTEDEWQIAFTETAVQYGSRRVWEWTESEFSDAHNRFAILKGGSDSVLKGSSWYAEGGPLEPDRSAKYILFSARFDRSSTVGFRCAVDLKSERSS